MKRLLYCHSLLFIFFFLGIFKAAAQDDHADSLLYLLNENQNPAGPNYTVATFKSTRIINGQSIENLGRGVLDFQVSHRFGTLNQSFNNFFGLDNAVTKLSFDYGLFDWLTIGVGRGTYEKEYNGFIKAKILRQTENNKMPVSLSYVGDIYLQTLQMNLPDGASYPFENRLSYMNQLLIARKFSSRLSLQLMPTHIHYNVVPTSADPNNIFAIGIAGRIKVTRRMAITGEYYYVIPGASLDGYHNALSVGLDVETGGHVFQLLFTNASAINERAVIGQTTGRWSKGDIHFGFNISRVFTIVKPKGYSGDY
jgi:hypothetical protein